MMAKSDAERQKASFERRKSAGLARVCVWVPEGAQKALRAYAAKLITKRIRAENDQLEKLIQSKNE